MELRESLIIYDTDSAFSKGTATWTFMSTIMPVQAFQKVTRQQVSRALRYQNADPLNPILGMHPMETRMNAKMLAQGYLQQQFLLKNRNNSDNGVLSGH